MAGEPNTPIGDYEFWTIGDSKTSGNNFQPQLVQKLQENTRISWQENPTRYATSGWTVADVAAGIDAALAARSGNPEFVLINLGANDAAAMPAEADYKTNYLYILDAIHVKYASAQIYLMRTWRRGLGTESNTLAGWIADIVSSRSSFVHLGPDERVFLENGDDGVTYTAEGVHPNAAGYTLTARQWRYAMGYPDYI